MIERQNDIKDAKRMQQKQHIRGSTVNEEYN